MGYACYPFLSIEYSTPTRNFLGDTDYVFIVIPITCVVTNFIKINNRAASESVKQ